MRSRNWTPDDLAVQYALAQQRGWVVSLIEACEVVGFPVATLLGIASRETGSLWATHPVDDRSFPGFGTSDCWRDAHARAVETLRILAAKAHYLARHGTPTRGVRVMPWATTVLAAYNCGEGNVLKALKEHLDVDYYTAHADYSADVLARAAIFQELLSS